MANSTAERAAADGRYGGLEGMPEGGTQLMPSPKLAELRGSAPATPMKYTGDHLGWFVTEYELAKKVLSDSRFSLKSKRLPANQAQHPIAVGSADIGSLLDAPALESLAVGNVLALDAEQHDKVRKAMIARFTLKSVRGHLAEIREIVATQLAHLKALTPPVDFTLEYTHPISARVHSLVLGIPDRFVEDYIADYDESSIQAQFDFVRAVLAEKADALAEDALSDLIRDDLDDRETEGAAWILMSVGRDNVSRLIGTMTIALLENREQWKILRDDPSSTAGGVEEIVRYGNMFLGLFVRTATDDFEIDGLEIEAGQSVSVSVVAANRDPERFENPDEFDVTRDAFGHLGFGFGSHSCVGQQLARVEIRESIAALIEGIPTLRLVQADQLEAVSFVHPIGAFDTGVILVGW